MVAERQHPGVQDGAAWYGKWRTVALGELVRNFDSRRVPLSGRVRAQRPGPYPYHGATGVMDHVDDYLFEGLHLLVAEDGSVEKPDGTPFLQLVDGQFWVNNHAHVLQGASDEETRYLYYALSTIPIRTFVSGSVQAKLSQANLNRIPIPYPAEESRRRAIIQVLGPLDDKIALNHRMNETLEAMAQALFKFWFIDFGPVRAKMEGRWCRGQSLPGLPAEHYDLFPDRLVQSELGEIPDGWEVKPLDEIAKFQNGLALQKFRPTENASRLPVVKIAQLRSGHTRGAEWATDNINPDCIIDDGDVVFSWSGSLLVKVWRGGRSALNQHLFKVTSTQYPKWFYLKCTELHLAEFQEIAAGKATTMGHIKREHLKSAKCVVPNQDIFSAVDGIFSKLLARQNSADLQSRSLAAQRKVLLPKLVSGKVNFLNTR